MAEQRWTLKDQNKTARQGWSLFNVKPCKLSETSCPHRTHGDIQRIDSMARFRNDREALCYAQGRADAGDKLAKRALRLAGRDV